MTRTPLVQKYIYLGEDDVKFSNIVFIDIVNWNKKHDDLD